MRHPWRIAITVGGLLLAANVFIIAGITADTSNQNRATAPGEVERLDPAPGSLRKPQEGVSVDLRPGYQGVLIIDGKELPEDQLNHQTASSVGFQPGPGKDLERLDAGPHTVTVVYWKQPKTRDDASTYSWSFRTAA